jgi:hypothetical protein
LCKASNGGLKETACGDFGRGLYCDLEANLRNEEINAESLAGSAIESVHKESHPKGDKLFGAEH